MGSFKKSNLIRLILAFLIIAVQVNSFNYFGKWKKGGKKQIQNNLLYVDDHAVLSNAVAPLYNIT
jgi:hypothetical protein